MRYAMIPMLLLSCNLVTAQNLPAWSTEVGAQSFPDATQVVRVNDHGAVADGKTLATGAIQKAIDACAQAGGGIVTFAPGRYLTGSLFVKSGVHLRIDRDVTLLGSQDLKDYPEIDTRVAGLEMVWPAALLNILDQNNAAITGQGTVHAQGKPFWDKYWTMRRDEYEPKGLRWIVDYDCKRPRTVLVSRGRNVTLKGLTLKQAGFWTVHVLYSQNVTVDGLIIRNNVDGHGPSTDGVDIDSSSHVLVQNCDIDCNDDNFCLKAGRDWDGLRVNRPCEYIVIRHCISRKGGGLITCGSETSGGIRHLLAYDLTAEGTGVGIRFKSAKTRGGIVEDIHIRDLTMNEVGTVIEVSMNWNPSYSYSTLPAGYSADTIPAHWKAMLTPVEPPERGYPEVRNITITNVSVKNARRAISAAGMPESIVKNVRLKNVNIEAREAGRIRSARGWRFEDVVLTTQGDANLQVIDCTDMKL